MVTSDGCCVFTCAANAIVTAAAATAVDCAVGRLRLADCARVRCCRQLRANCDRVRNRDRQRQIEREREREAAT